MIKKEKSPDAPTSEQNSKKPTIRLHPINRDVKFIYEEYDIVRAAELHPERIDNIINDAIIWGASNWTMAQLEFIKYGKWGWEF